MTQTVILLLSLAAAGPVAGRVVSGSGLRAGQPILRDRVVGAPARGAPVALLTTGGCLVRLSAGGAVTLGKPTNGTRCSSVRVVRGRVRLLAPTSKGAGPALAVVLGKHTVTLTGEGVARHDGVTGLCVNRGSARLTTPPGVRPASPPTGKVTVAPAPKPSTSNVSPGQCLWLTASGTTRSAYKPAVAARDHKATATTYGFAVPEATVTVDLNKELASLSAALHSGSGGGSDVEGGGQSMCLETGNEGSAIDPGSSSADVTKPPPPTQLRLILTLEPRVP